MPAPKFEQDDRVYVDGQRGSVVNPDTTLGAETPDPELTQDQLDEVADLVEYGMPEDRAHEYVRRVAVPTAVQLDVDRRGQPMRRVLINIDDGPNGEDQGYRLVYEEVVFPEPESGPVPGEVVADPEPVNTAEWDGEEDYPHG